MKVTLLIWVAFLALWPSVGSATDDVLVVRYACLMGGRAAGAAPTSAGVLSRSELSDFLLAWNPGSDNEEVRTVFALNELGELARQASQLPLAGGAVSGVYTHGDSIFEIDMEIRPSGSMSREQEVMTIMAEIKGDGELISGSKIHVPLNERAIITTSTGPEAPFLFLVVEVDRLSADELMRRGLRHSWRRDYRLVDGVEVTQPAAIEQSPPSYPAEAKESRHEGRVVLRLVVNEAGKVDDVEVVEGQPYGLSEAASSAARSWRFEPARHHGEPVAVFYLMTVNFRLE